MLSYPVTLKTIANGVVATCPDFPELCIVCDDGEDALAKLAGWLEEALAIRVARRQDIPEPSKGRRKVAMSAQTAIKARLYQTARSNGITRQQLMRLLGWHGPQVDRLFDLRCASRTACLEAAAKGLGLQLIVGVAPLAAADRARPVSRRSPSTNPANRPSGLGRRVDNTGAQAPGQIAG